MPYDPERHGPTRIVGPGFHERVYALAKRIPRGRVTSYGDIARALGSVARGLASSPLSAAAKPRPIHPDVLASGSVRFARHVGYALAALPPSRKDVPWHRVVSARGRISLPPEDPAAREQRRRLGREGIEVDAAGRVERFAELRFVFPGSPAGGPGAAVAGDGERRPTSHRLRRRPAVR